MRVYGNCMCFVENKNLSLLSDSKKSKSSSHCEAFEIITEGNQELGFCFWCSTKSQSARFRRLHLQTPRECWVFGGFPFPNASFIICFQLI
jgi:hypothetical protein